MTHMKSHMIHFKGASYGDMIHFKGASYGDVLRISGIVKDHEHTNSMTYLPRNRNKSTWERSSHPVLIATGDVTDRARSMPPLSGGNINNTNWNTKLS